MNDSSQFDLIVVGGGGAGLPAAISAIESGVERVLLIEKRPNPGGNAGMAGGFMFAAESRHQKAAGQVVGKDAIFKEMLAFNHYDRIDPRLIRAFLDRSAETVDWLEERGGSEWIFGGMENLRSHVPKDLSSPVGGFGKVIRVLAKRLTELGGQITSNTAVKSISFEDGTGKYLVKAERKDGTALDFQAKSIILCSGGFTGNTEKLKSSFPHYYDQEVYWTDAVPNMGEGVEIAESLGADLAPYCTLVRETCYSFTTKKNLPNRASTEPFSLWVNSNGVRFADESISFDNSATNALLNQPGKSGFAIFDDEMISVMSSRSHQDEVLADLIPLIDVRAIFENEAADGEWVAKADDLGDLATFIGAERTTLLQTVAEYNEQCRAGKDTLFAKDAKFLMELKKGPYFAIRFRPLMVETAGPVIVNDSMNVLNKDGRGIPGCFAAGALTSGWVGHDYHLFGYALSWAVTSGLIAGEAAAKYLQSNKTA